MARELPVSADDAWYVLGERFDDVTWTSQIDESWLDGELGVGAERVCRFEPNMFSKTGEARERLIRFDRDAKALAYEIVDLPGVMTKGINRWTITPLGPDRCRIASHATCEFTPWIAWLNPVLRLMLKRMGRQFIADLLQQTSARRTQPTARPSERSAPLAAR